MMMSDPSFGPVFFGGFFEPVGLPPPQWARPSATILMQPRQIVLGLDRRERGDRLAPAR